MTKILDELSVHKQYYIRLQLNGSRTGTPMGWQRVNYNGCEFIFALHIDLKVNLRLMTKKIVEKHDSKRKTFPISSNVH